ncbi:hypothetical protein HHI36_020675 [Cryptolaemus montrouzieri]|uniref:Gustatory receptor n=1 Tax=Cryptolaemus montrouzieri TaxID=559131 RepID=A0ABD2NB80_9CUCU
MNENPEMCLCRFFGLVFYIGRTIGVSPVIWKHEEGTCVYRKSMYSLTWSFVLIILLVLKLGTYTEFEALTAVHALPILLNGVTDLLYYLYLMVMILNINWRATQWEKLLNNMNRVSRNDGLLCETALRTGRKVTYTFVATVFLIVISNCAILAYLQFSDSYETKFSFQFIGGKVMQNGVLMFYVYVFSYTSAFIGILTCFEKVSLAALKYKKIEPMEKITPSDNQQEIFFGFTYTVCASEHIPSPEISELTKAEVLEYFRILHERISELINGFNGCMNPLLLVHVVIEIIVIVINWYSVIIKIAYDFTEPETQTIFVLNLVFAISHTIGLFVFLRNGQKLSNMVQGYIGFLTEYSTRVSTEEEYIQVRIFIEKIEEHRQFSASGIFPIDLGIAGPV